MIPGIDVASYQGAVDWSLVARAGRQFGFTKATEGVAYTNPTFAANWAGMKAVGLVRGAYHFADPDHNHPQAEADYFLGTVGPLEIGDLLALDIEQGTGPLGDWVTTWLEYVTARVGFKPLLYSADWFMRPHALENNDNLKEYGLWVAAYQATPPPVPARWLFMAIWQYSAQNRVPGIAGNVDENLFNGDLAGLKRYGKIA